jgi:hypothetical protein
MKKLIACAVLLFFAVASNGVFSSEDDERLESQKQPVNSASDKDAEPAKASVWMRMKMKGTTGVLTGLATGDFEMIKENAQRMNALLRLERIARGKNEQYQLQLKLFRYANQELIRQADQRNIDGAAMAFAQLTTSCVNCHRMVRDDGTPNVVEARPDLTHVIQRAVEYYSQGPQQAHPPEGSFAKGTIVQVIEAAGNYTQVRSANGIIAFVDSDSLAPSATHR